MATDTSTKSKISVEYEKTLKALKKLKTGPSEEFYRNVGARLKANFLMGFKNSSAPDGSPWKPIHHRKGQPLIDTARLKNSINYKATGTQVEIGTNVKYARVQQEGGPGVVNVPAHTTTINHIFGVKLKKPFKTTVKAHKANIHIKPRPFLGIADPQRAIISKVFAAYLDKYVGS